MTLIASMRAKYGAIIVGDSQETAIDAQGNEYKYSVPKNEPQRIAGFSYVIAGGGDGDAIDELSERFKRALLKSKRKTLSGFRDLFERTLGAELRMLEAEAHRRKYPHPRLEIIVGCATGGKWDVWKNARKTLVTTPLGTPVLAGYDAEIYRHIGSELFPHATTTAQIVLVGLRILELARRSSTCVDSPYSGVVVLPHGLFQLSTEVLKQLAESMVLFGSLLDCLLLACGDTTLPSEEFTKLIDEAREHMGHMRKDYLQAVAEKDFLSEWETGMISPIPLIPSGLVRSARFDGKRSPKVTVDKPEIDE